MATNRAKYVYAPKPGDEVKWPNGVVMTFNDDGEIVVTANDDQLWGFVIEGEPGDSTLTLTRRPQ